MHPERFEALSRRLGDATSRRGLLSLVGIGVAGTAITAVGLTEAEAKRKNAKKKNKNAKKAKRTRQATAEQTTALAPLPVTGSSDFTGTFDVTSFAVQNGQLVAFGLLSGTRAATGQTINNQIQWPVDLAQSSGSCTILTLVLGPLHLDLLGLVVDLNQVELEITAERGPGNLLGNLLCAIAGLLNGSGGALNRLADLLNQLLGLLQ